RHGGVGRDGIDRRLAGRRRAARGAAADADLPARLRAHGARSDRDGGHDLPACRHRADADDRASGEAGMTVLATEHLSITFGGVHALEDVNLAIAPGIVFSIIGPNGAG